MQTPTPGGAPPETDLPDLRPYRSIDFAGCKRLWSDLGLSTWYNPPEKDIPRWLDAPNSEILVLAQGEEIVGTVAVGHDGHRGWLYALAVRPELRGRGQGRRLVQAAEAWLAARGIPKVQLMVRVNNERAKGFYGALGYHTEPRRLFARWLESPGTPPEDAPVPDWLRPETAAPKRIDVIITYLEMYERPSEALAKPPRGKPVALLRAHNPTLGFYRFLYESVGKPWLWWERLVLSDEDLTAIIHDPLVEIYVLYVDGVPAGYGELDRRKRPDINLNLFGLMPEFVGRGLGAYFLTSIIDIAWSHEPKRLLVNTNTLDHPRALPTYQRCGFSPIGQEETVFIDPRRNGIILA